MKTVADVPTGQAPKIFLGSPAFYDAWQDQEDIPVYKHAHVELPDRVRLTKVGPSRTEFFVEARKSEWSALEMGVCEITFDVRADEAAKAPCEN